jgi:hypothetical protein
MERGTTVNMELFRGTIDPTTTTGTGLGGETLKGMERNTARGVKESAVITGITKIEYAPATDAPEVVGFKTYGEN